MGSAGFGVAQPYEAYPSKHDYVNRFDLDDDAVFSALLDKVKRGSYWYIHIGLPCSSWSSLQHLNGGTRRQTRPQGDGSLHRELLGNLQATRVAQLCEAQHVLGKFYSIENPAYSHVWGFGPIAALSSHAIDVVFDQCEYGLAPPQDSEFAHLRIKKPTKLRTNLECLRKLECRCQHGHQHFACRGSVKTQSGWKRVSAHAGAYPPALCGAWAQAAREAGPRRDPAHHLPAGAIAPRGRAKLGPDAEAQLATCAGKAFGLR